MSQRLRRVGSFALVAMGARWVRADFAWDAIEPQPGIYAWSGFDQFVSAVRARNVNVIATLAYTPAGANGGYADHDYQPASPKAFGRFAGRVAARYASRGSHL